MKAPTFLRGKHIDLRALSEADADGPYLTWFNNAEVCRGNSHHVLPYTRNAALEYVRHAQETKTDLILAIVLKENGLHIGNIALQHIHPLYRSAEIAIIIGDREAWGKGYGKEATFLVCKHGFDVLNLHRISCGTFAGNEGMIHLAKALGMKEEGRRRDAAFKNGEYVDVIDYGLLKEDFNIA